MDNGIIDEIVKRTPRPGMTAYDIIIDGKKYGLGFTAPRGVAVGDRVQFEPEQKGSFWNIKAGTLKAWEGKDDPSEAKGRAETSTQRPLERATSDPKDMGSTRVAPPMSKDDYWRRKEEYDRAKEAKWDAREEEKQARITFEACRKQAMDYVSLLIQAECIWLKKLTKEGDKQEYLRTLIEDTHRRMYREACNRNDYLGGKPLTTEDLSIHAITTTFGAIAALTGNAEAPADGEWK
jgi:hypothetical protein